MKTARKHAFKCLTIVFLTIIALTCPLFQVGSTEGGSGDLGEQEQEIEAREAYLHMLLQDENGNVPPDAWSNAYAEKEAMSFLPEAWAEFLPPPNAQGTDPNALSWGSIGPGNIGGRMRSIIIDPRDSDTIWIGGVSGGVWKTSNGGRISWSTNTDLLANLAIGCMVMDPTNPDILYAGTGGDYGYASSVPGDGIFKSTDGGNHWAQLESTKVIPPNVDFSTVYSLAICPTNSQILLAGTGFGIFRSTDGGAHWSRPTGAPNNVSITNISFKPLSDMPQIAFINIPAINCLAGSSIGYVYYSEDDGENWERNVNNGLTGISRVELAYSRSNPMVVYASKAKRDSTHPNELFYSDDGGYSFASRGYPFPNDLTGGDTHTNVVWVDPTDSETVVVGGIFLARTTNGGSSWEVVNGSSHLDHHIIIEDPGYTGVSGDNKIVYCGTDGGIYRTENILANAIQTSQPDDPVTWESRNNRLGITQFYGGAGNAITGTIIGGTQDNGTMRYQGNSEAWRILDGNLTGDGAFCAADQVPNSQMPFYYGEAPHLQIYRSTDLGISKQYIIDGDHPIPRNCGQGSMVPCANFVAPFVLDPNDRTTLLGGGDNLWRTNNARDDETEVDWESIKSPIAGNSYITAIAIAGGDSDFIWVGHQNGAVFYTTTGTAGPAPSYMPSWTPADPFHILPPRVCTRITIGAPAINGSRMSRPVYATFGGFFGATSGNVWKRQTDGTWLNIHNNLPKTPVYSLVISPNSPNVLYVGTEIGVFATADGGATWSPGNGGPANTRVTELFWMDTKLVAVTHGRGMFVIPSPTE